MKVITYTLVGLCVLLLHVQADANRLEAWVWNDGIDMKRPTKFGPRYFFYPGNSQIDVLIGNDNLGCSLRVGTQSNNPNLLKISGPLVVKNNTNPVTFLKELGRTVSAAADPRYGRFAFKCGTTGEINVSSPPAVAVPAVITLAYGPNLN